MRGDPTRCAAHAVRDGWFEACSALVMTRSDYGPAVDISAGFYTGLNIAWRV